MASMIHSDEHMGHWEKLHGGLRDMNLYTLLPLVLSESTQQAHDSIVCNLT
jgi:hypothetical protein